MQGRWLVRIEDIDPPREVPGAADLILRTLERLDLCWDGTVLYQSTRRDAYRELANELVAKDEAYRCSCTRSELRRRGGPQAEQLRYPGYCRTGHRPGLPTAIRVVAPAGAVTFDDGLQGRHRYVIGAMTGDFVIYRRDELPAYHLAVVADDAYQSVTHVVRGTDLLESTPLHIHLQTLLDLPTPDYAHVPVIVNALGQKLSKQTGATPIEPEDSAKVAFAALGYLGAEPPCGLIGARPAELWDWAREAWTLDALKGTAQLTQ